MWRMHLVCRFLCLLYLALSASSGIANGYLISPLATEQKAGVAKVAKGMIRGVRQVRSSEYLGITYQKDTKDIGS